MILQIPIIFVHRGYSDYMEFSLRQAVATNPNGIIILLGDESSPEIAGVRRIMSHDYENETLAEFRKHYRHMSYNPEAFERICFERWLLIAELFRREKLDVAFVVDTDVMIYADLSELFSNFNKDVKCGFSETSIDSDDEAYKPLSGHSSYWTGRAMFEFEALLSQLYVAPELRNKLEKRWAEYSLNHIYGGITDMDALGLFRCGLRNDEFINTCELSRCDGVFDHSLCATEGVTNNQYQMHGLLKRLEWKDNLPYGIERESGKRVRFYTLHCQGRYKSFMAGFYTGASFAGVRRLTVVFEWRKYKFVLERLIKSTVKSILKTIAPALLSRKKSQKG